MRLPANSTQKFVLASVLCGLALALSLVDAALSSALLMLPGFKLGLANIVSLFALYVPGLPFALAISVVRALVTALLSGGVTMLPFSLLGGITSILIMYLFMQRISIIKVSVLGGVTHNCMQVLTAMLITSTPQAGFFLPPLVATGAATGFVMGILCAFLMQRLKVNPSAIQSKKRPI